MNTNRQCLSLTLNYMVLVNLKENCTEKLYYVWPALSLVHTSSFFLFNPAGLKAKKKNLTAQEEPLY